MKVCPRISHRGRRSPRWSPVAARREVVTFSVAGSGDAPPGLPRCPHCNHPMTFFSGNGRDCPARSAAALSGSRILASPARWTRPAISDDFSCSVASGKEVSAPSRAARDSDLKPIVALKVPHASLLTLPGYTERCLREARSAAALRHPGIVTLYEVVTLGNCPDPRLRLHQRADAGRPPENPPPDLPRIRGTDGPNGGSPSVCPRTRRRSPRHQARQPHGRVRPVCRLQAGGQARPRRPAGYRRLRVALRGEAEIVMSADGQIIGTPAYMSPEQASGRVHSVNGRATSTAWASCCTNC